MILSTIFFVYKILVTTCFSMHNSHFSLVKIRLSPSPILQTSSQDKSFGPVSSFVGSADHAANRNNIYYNAYQVLTCISEVENSHCSILCLPTNVCSHLILSFLVQPGPRDGIIQCFIKRDKSTSTYYLYLCLSPGKYQVCALFFSLISFNIVRSNFI